MNSLTNCLAVFRSHFNVKWHDKCVAGIDCIQPKIVMNMDTKSHPVAGGLRGRVQWYVCTVSHWYWRNTLIMFVYGTQWRKEAWCTCVAVVTLNSLKKGYLLEELLPRAGLMKRKHQVNYFPSYSKGEILFWKFSDSFPSWSQILFVKWEEIK